jgi:hypothetical protein
VQACFLLLLNSGAFGAPVSKFGLISSCWRSSCTFPHQYHHGYLAICWMGQRALTWAQQRF